MKNKLSVKIILALVVIAAVAGGNAFAGSLFSEGSASAQILELPVDARAVALGGAYTSIAEGANSVYWNPSAMASLQADSIGFMHAMFFESIVYDYLAYAFPMDKYGSFGLGVQYLNYGGVERRDNLGNKEGNFVPKDTVVSFAYSRMLYSIPVGVTLKLINSELVNKAATAAVDFGFQFPVIADYLTIGGTVKNFGGSLKYSNKNEQLPLSVNIGAGWRANSNVLLTGEITASKTADPYFGAGAEFTLYSGADVDVKLRGGYKSRMINSKLGGLAGINSGLGFSIGMYEVNYAWSPMGELGTNHYLSIALDFGKDSKKEVKTSQGAQAPKYRPVSTQNADEEYKIESNVVNEKALERMVAEYKKVVKSNNYNLDGSEQFGKAIRLYNSGDYAESYKFFDVVNRYSDNNVLVGEAQIGMAECALKLNDNELVRSILIGLLNYLPAYREDERVKLIYAKLYIATGDYNKAMQALKDDDSDDMVWLRVDAYKQAGQYTRALAEARYHMELFPDSYRSEERSIMMAELQYANKEYDKAVDDFASFMARYPNSPKLLYVRYMAASSYLLKGNYEQAYKIFSEVAESKIEKELAGKSLFLKAEAAQFIGRDEEALNIYARIAQNKYSQALTRNSHYRICLINLKNNNVDELEKISSRYSRQYEESKFTMIYGLTQYLKNKPERAFTYFNRALEQAKTTEDIDSSLALISFVSSPSNTKVLISQQAASQNWARHIALFFTAEGFYNQALFNEAEKIFFELQSSIIDPNLRALTEIRYSDCLVQQGKYEEGLLSYKRLEEKPAISSQVERLLLTGLGHANFKLERYLTAADYYERAVKSYSDNENAAEVYYYLGESYSRGGIYSKAVSTWVDMAKKFPKYPKSKKAYLDALNLAFGMGEYEKAVSMASDAGNYYEDIDFLVETKMLAAKAQNNMQNYAKSVEIYQELMSGTTEQMLRDRVEKYLSQSYYQIGINDPNAEKMLDEFAQKYSNHSIIGEVYWQAGAKFFDAQKFDEAQKRFHKVVTLYPHCASAPQALFYLAESIYWQGQLENALQYYETFEKNYPEDISLATTSRFRMANAYFKQGRIPLSVDFYKKILESGISSDIRKNSMLNLAIGLYRLNEIEQSVDTFKRFISEYPDAPETNTARYQTARILKDEGKLQEAATYYALVKPAADITETELAYRIGEAYSKIGDQEQTIAAFKKLMPLSPKNDVYRFRGLVELAGILEERKEYAQVIDIFRELKKSTSDKEAKRIFDAKLKELEYKQANKL